MDVQIIPLPAGTVFQQYGRDDDGDLYAHIPVFAAAFHGNGAEIQVFDGHGKTYWLGVGTHSGRIFLPSDPKYYAHASH